jgi:hypothetical protein
MVSRHINGISINGDEYLLDDNDIPMEFRDEEEAKEYLKQHHYEEEVNFVQVEENTMRVVTYISPNGHKIDICPECAASIKEWPKDEKGAEYCSVSHGLHRGECGICSHSW